MPQFPNGTRFGDLNLVSLYGVMKSSPSNRTMYRQRCGYGEPLMGLIEKDRSNRKTSLKPENGNALEGIPSAEPKNVPKFVHFGW